MPSVAQMEAPGKESAQVDAAERAAKELPGAGSAYNVQLSTQAAAGEIKK